MSRLWLDHLKTIHESSTTKQSPVTLSSLRTRVRLIHELKHIAHPNHAHYFHDNIDEFIEKSAIQSLETYITHYLPLILSSSIQQTKETEQLPPNDASSTTPPSHTIPTFITIRTILPSSTTSPTLHPSQEETPHRKRTRRRLFSRVFQALRTWASGGNSSTNNP